MTIRPTHLFLTIPVLLLGAACGKLIHAFANRGQHGSPESPAGASGHRVDAARRSFSPISTSARYLWQETEALRDDGTFTDEVARIHRESRSPLRAESLLSFRIRNSTFEEWEALLSEGKVERLDFLEELGEHLALTDPERAIRLFFRGRIPFGNIHKFYAFRSRLIPTAAATNPEMILEELKGMKRGGGQMDTSIFFSDLWAKSDPRAAAGNFTDLVALRNMQLEGSVTLPDKAFAEFIMNSWMQKAPAEAVEYIDSLPDSPTRRALEAALDQIAPPL